MEDTRYRTVAFLHRKIVPLCSVRFAIGHAFQIGTNHDSKHASKNWSFLVRLITHARCCHTLLTSIIALLAGYWPRSEGKSWSRSRGSVALSIRVPSLRCRFRHLPLQRVSFQNISAIFLHRSFGFPSEE